MKIAARAARWAGSCANYTYYFPNSAVTRKLIETTDKLAIYIKTTLPRCPLAAAGRDEALAQAV
jgi:hypothetical protein